MSVYERCGHILGYVVGVITGLISFIRGSRMFHPQGILFEATVNSLEFSPHAIVRLSSAWWKNKEWRDVLGVAIRFSPASPRSVIPTPSDQDLLFASFSRWWMTPIGPFLTHYEDFLTNHYYTVAHFQHAGVLKTYKLVPKNVTIHRGTRKEKLLEAVLEGEAVFLLMERILNETSWKKVAEIKLIRTIHFDQEALRFDPFQNGLHIRPRGFLQHLRIGTYRLSQLARPSSEAE